MRILTIGICKSSEFEYVLWQTKNMSALLESAYLLVLLTTWQWPFKMHQSWYCWASIFLRGLKRTRATGPTAISDEAYLANGPFNPSPGDSRFRCIKIDFVKKRKIVSFINEHVPTTIPIPGMSIRRKNSPISGSSFVNLLRYQSLKKNQGLLSLSLW